MSDPSKLEWRSASDLKIKFNTNLRISTAVKSVDPKAKTVTTEEGETIGYDQLVLAPGGKPRRLPVQGFNLGKVYTLRHVEDAKQIETGA